MKRTVVRSFLAGLAVGAWVQWGLVPTAWLFYEAYHALGVDTLYTIYTGFKAVGDMLDWWPGRFWVSFGTVVLVTSSGLVLRVLRLRRTAGEP